MANQDLELYEAMWEKEDHIGNESYQELKRLILLHEICSENHNELNEFLARFYTYKNKAIFGKGDRINKEIKAFVRHCYNYLSTAIARKELFFGFKNRYPDIISSKEADLIRDNISLIAFVEEFRNLLLHSKVPPIFIRKEVSIYKEPYLGLVIKTDFLNAYFRKKSSGEKKENALSYMDLNSQNGMLDLHLPLKEYERIMNEYYSIVFTEIQSGHKVEYPDYHALLEKIN